MNSSSIQSLSKGLIYPDVAYVIRFKLEIQQACTKRPTLGQRLKRWEGNRKQCLRFDLRIWGHWLLIKCYLISLIIFKLFVKLHVCGLSKRRKRPLSAISGVMNSWATRLQSHGLPFKSTFHNIVSQSWVEWESVTFDGNFYFYLRVYNFWSILCRKLLISKFRQFSIDSKTALWHTT